MKRKISISISVIIVIILYLFTKSPSYLSIRSYVVMKPYSYNLEMKSFIKDKNIDLDIPGGNITKAKDWYPFTLVHNADEGFSRYVGKDLSLTILYNFGHFNPSDGSSSYFNPDSPYYGSFYGGYVIYNKENPSNPYGLNDDGSINFDELNAIPEYDQTKLVLPSLGCPVYKREFDSEVDAIYEDVDYIGSSGWTRIDSTIRTNGPIHKYKKDYRGYIQYGRPSEKYYRGEDFPVETFKGRVYVKYIEEFEVTVALYIMAPNEDTVDECDEEILSKSRIKNR